MEKLLLVFETEKTGSRIKEMIETAGLAECFLCHSAAEAKRLVHSKSIFAAVCGYKFQDETAESLFEDLPDSCYGLVLAPQSILVLIGNERLFKLVAPVSRGDLLAAVGMLLQASAQEDRTVRSGRTRKERETIDAAKQLLIAQMSMSEEQAHRYLQKRSMDSGIKMFKTAHMVLDGSWKDWYNK